MSISSELTALQNDITNARTAITNKGGTVTLGGGSSQLASDIATIPSGVATETFDVTPTTSNQTITPSSGKYFSSGTVRAMPSGSRGSLSVNKSISGTTATITAKEAAGTAGYINPTSRSSSSTTVTASDLTSGTQSITANGTYDVTSNKSVSVNVEGRKYATGTWNYSANTTLAEIGSVNCGFQPSIFLLNIQGTPSSSASYSTSEYYLTCAAFVFRLQYFAPAANAFVLLTRRTSSSANNTATGVGLNSVTPTSTGISISSSNNFKLLKNMTYKWEAWGE